MKLKTSLNGKTYEFKSIADVLAKANEPKSADRFQGIAAETASERVAAKIVLSEMTVEELTEHPTLPYETDEVTRVNLDGLNRPMYERFKSKTIGELREWVLDHRTTSEELGRPDGLHRRGGGRRGKADVHPGPGVWGQQDPPAHQVRDRNRTSRNTVLSVAGK